MLMVVFADIAPSKQPIIRFLMALSAGFFASFFLGDVVLNGKIGELQISAAGGIALFILIQFVFNPFQVLPSRSSPALPVPTPAAMQSPPATPTQQSDTTPRHVRTVSTPVATPTGKAPPAILDVGEALKQGEGWTESGNPRDKQKALDLYRSRVQQFGCGRFAPDLLKQANDAYASQNYDSALANYKAILRRCDNK